MKMSGHKRRDLGLKRAKNNSNSTKYVVFLCKDTRRPFARRWRALGTEFHSLLRVQPHRYKEDNVSPLFITYILPERQIKIPQCKRLMNNQYQTDKSFG